ncbi:FT-interacting protein [Vigna angularis]|uniref:FT-interacting protein n=1 Tax=Phaseolus angularis TaxID=3914 RepID=A0A8T0JXC1_PHAAN|nr:FT-interacting protein [Vigna angularis]
MMANQNENQQQKKQKEDFSLKVTTPNINAGRVISGDRLPTAFDLVEKMQFLMRRGKAQFYRIAGLLNVLVFAGKQFHDIHSWKSSMTTVVSYLMFLLIIFLPKMILPSAFSFLLMVGIWRYRTRPRYPSHMDMSLSQADTATVEELEEEFDPFPSKVSGENLKKRYDRLRAVAGRVVEVMADLATQGERVQSLLSWRDPRATVLFVIFCFVAVIVTYFVPFRVLMFIWLTYVLRPPRFRSFDIPAVPQNFLRRMPAKSDAML